MIFKEIDYMKSTRSSPKSPLDVVVTRDRMMSCSFSPRGSRYYIIKELGLKDHVYYGLGTYISLMEKYLDPLCPVICFSEIRIRHALVFPPCLSYSQTVRELKSGVKSPYRNPESSLYWHLDP